MLKRHSTRADLPAQPQKGLSVYASPGCRGLINLAPAQPEGAHLFLLGAITREIELEQSQHNVLQMFTT